MNTDKMKPEHTREFNLEHAKAGAPYCQRNGLPARIGIWDALSEYSLVGVKLGTNGKEVSASWTNAGQFSMSEPDYIDDLVMLPLGYCDGKPVFVGDELDDREGIYKVAVGSHYFETSKWPREEPVMPTCESYTGLNRIISDGINEHFLRHYRAEIEAYWKALDEFNGAQK